MLSGRRDVRTQKLSKHDPQHIKPFKKLQFGQWTSEVFKSFQKVIKFSNLTT